MFNTFYIVEVRPNWFNLRILPNHYTLSCGNDLEVFKRVIKDYVVKHKTPERLLERLKECEDRGEVVGKTLDLHLKEYNSGRHEVFSDLIYESVKEAKDILKEQSPIKKALRRVRPLVSSYIEEDITPSLPLVKKVGLVKKVKRTLLED